MLDIARDAQNYGQFYCYGSWPYKKCKYMRSYVNIKITLGLLHCMFQKAGISNLST